MAGDVAALATAVLAFLDTDAVYGPDHARPRTAQAALRDATAAALHEDGSVDLEHVPLRVIEGGLSAAS